MLNVLNGNKKLKMKLSLLYRTSFDVKIRAVLDGYNTRKL